MSIEKMSVAKILLKRHFSIVSLVEYNQRLVEYNIYLLHVLSIFKNLTSVVNILLSSKLKSMWI